MDVPKEYSELLGIFDSITIYSNIAIEGYTRVSKSHLDLAKCFEETRKKWKRTLEENQTLSMKLKEKEKKIRALEESNESARRLLEEEKYKTKAVAKERNHYASQLNLFRDILKHEDNIHEETKIKLSLINNLPNRGDRLDTITELDSTDSIMSDLSYTRDDEDLDVTDTDTRGAKRQFLADENVAPSKRRRSSTTTKKIEIPQGENIEKVIATTTVTMEHHGPISATSVVETIPSVQIQPQTPNPYYHSTEDSSEELMWAPSTEKLPATPFGINSLNTRPHKFTNHKAMIKGDICNACNRKIKFSAPGAKCKECKTVCHAACKDKVPLPCLPATITPGKNNGIGTIADFTPKRGPMIPALVVHCIKEIEARGLNEVGLYRIPGSDKEVKALKERFLRGKGVPNLSQTPDIHTICGCLKEFLRSLKEPIITQIRWDQFTKAVEFPDPEDRRARLFHIVSQLPQPNRDTLAYIILHLQKVAEAPECKMPNSNLAKMFGPTIVGYSRNEPDNLFAETNLGHKVMSELISIPAEYWEPFMRESEVVQNENELHKTPSSNSLLNFFHNTPGRQHIRTLRKQRYFETP